MNRLQNKFPFFKNCMLVRYLSTYCKGGKLIEFFSFVSVEILTVYLQLCVLKIYELELEKCALL